MPSFAAAYKGLAGTVQQPEGVEVPLEVFGGLCIEDTPQDLPEGSCPDNQNVDFVPGSVFTRAGLTRIFANISGGPTVNYLKTFSKLDGTNWMLALDGLGGVWAEKTTAVLTAIGTAVAGSYGQSCTQFGREYMAFSDGLFGLDIPRQYDGTNFDRVSQSGPGSPPIVIDSALVRNIASITQPGAVVINSINSDPATLLGDCITTTAHNLQVGFRIAITGTVNFNGNFSIEQIISATEFIFSTAPIAAPEAVGNVFSSLTTVTLTAPLASIVPGLSFTIAGAGVAAYDGTHTVFAVTSSTVFTYIQGAGNLGAAGAAGTVTIAGSISAGVHKMVVIFVTRNGYLTAPSPITSWTAAGSLAADVGNIPIGPPQTVARILAFTSAGGAFFFWIPQATVGSITGTIINDNTTTSAIIDFTDATLLSAASIDSQGANLFNLGVLGECLGFVGYADRIFAWGERNKVQNFLNMDFDGGFDTNGIPLGWTQDPTNGIGTAKSGFPYYGDSFQLTGTATAANRSMITQSAFQDSFKVPILQPNTSYSVRFRVAWSGNAPSSGGIRVTINSASSGLLGVFIVSAVSSITQTYQEFIGLLGTMPATIPADTLLRVENRTVFAVPTQAGCDLNLDCLNIFPTNQPFLSTNIRCSYVNDPESFDLVTGNLGVDVENGEDIRCLFVMNDNLYIVKENSMFVTSDTGGEPSTWTVSQVSNTVGTLSVHGVDVGERWAVVVGRSGVFMFNGGEPMKMSQEIATDEPGLLRGWDSVRWNNGQRIWVVNDDTARRLYIGLPIGNGDAGPATIPNKIYMLNYKELNSAGAIADQGPVRVGFSGKILSTDFSRKWSPWTIKANCGAMIERPDGTAHFFVGNNTNTGSIYDYLGTNDDGAAITSYYNTYFFIEHQAEQALGIGTNRKLFKMLSMYVSGVGALSITATPLILTSALAVTLPTITLQASPTGYVEIPINVQGERVSFKFQVSALNSSFNMSTIVATLTRNPYAPIRGVI